MDFVGTVKVNKKGIPKECVIKDKGPGKKVRGDVCSKMLKLNNSKCLYFTGFMDKKPVHILSSFPTMIEYCSRNSKDATGKYQKTQITRPTVVTAYNQIMGGTDKMDQLASYYDDRQRVLKWQMRLFAHFLRISVINARILYNCRDSQYVEDMTLLQFTKQVVSEWCQSSYIEPNVRDNSDTSDSEECIETEKRPDEAQKRNTKVWWNINPESRISGHFHTPVFVSSSKTRNTNDERQRCKICGEKIKFKCQECNTFLHIGSADLTETGCWKKFHETKTL